MREGHGWARWAVLAVGLPMLATSAYVSSYLASLVDEGPPWRGALTMLVVFILGVVLFERNPRL